MKTPVSYSITPSSPSLSLCRRINTSWCFNMAPFDEKFFDGESSDGQYDGILKLPIVDGILQLPQFLGTSDNAAELPLSIDNVAVLPSSFLGSDNVAELPLSFLGTSDNVPVPPTPAELVQLLTKPPSVAVPSQVATRTVALFDTDWNSERLDILLDDYRPNQRHVIPDSQFDKTSSILYNIPIGTVMTLQNDRKREGGTVADLSDCSTCLDLVGTGTTEAITLWPVGFDNQVSMFFWRNVDLNFGAIELFEHRDFGGSRTTIFLSEWAPGTVHSLRGWIIKDQASSVRWRTLGDRQTAKLYSNDDGTGVSYSNIKGWGRTKEVSRLSTVRFNDYIGSFKWESVVPIKEIIEPLTIMASNSSNSFGLNSVVEGVNNSSEPQPVTVSLNNTTEQTTTVETSDKHVAGVTATLTQTLGASTVGISSSTQWSVGLSYSYERTKTKKRTDKQTVGLVVTQTVFAPPGTRYKATLLVTIGKVPSTEYRTTAQRWYLEPVTGAEVDPRNKGWYKRVEEVRVTIAASLACSIKVDMQATKLKE